MIHRSFTLTGESQLIVSNIHFHKFFPSWDFLQAVCTQGGDGNKLTAIFCPNKTTLYKKKINKALH